MCIRDRTVLTAPAPGSIRFLVKDGDSVRVGDVIAEIGDDQALSAVKDSLSDAQAGMRLYEEQTGGEFATLTEAIEDCYHRLVSAFFRMQTAYAAGDVPGLAESEQEFSQEGRILSKKRADLKAIEDERSRLAHEYEILQKIVASASVKILAPVSGTFSSQLFSRDSEIRSSNLEEKDASQLTVLAKELANTKAYQVENGQEVAQGDAIGRIVSGENVRFFLTVKTEQRPDIQTGDKVLVELDDRTSFNSTITGVVAVSYTHLSRFTTTVETRFM